MSQSGQPQEKKERLLSREQQLMWRVENKGTLKGKPKDERAAAREKMLEQVKAMSEGDRAKFIGDLQTKWDALPETERQALKKKGKGGGKKGGKGGGKGGNKKRRKAAAGDDE